MDFKDLFDEDGNLRKDVDVEPFLIKKQLMMVEQIDKTLIDNARLWTDEALGLLTARNNIMDSIFMFFVRKKIGK